MDPFEQAAKIASEVAPAPPDRPLVAALTAAGFGILVVGLFVVLQSVGLSLWLCWLGSAAAYGAIAYLDCQLGWRRHRREYHVALEALKAERAGHSLH